MRRFRDNLFYFCSLLGFVAWLVRLVSVMNICGWTHPIILRELILLGVVLAIFFGYARKSYLDVDEQPFNGRAEISGGDVIIFRFLAPWILLLGQIIVAVGLILFCSEIQSETKTRVCEYRGRFQ